jgi:hypothetical protein
MNKEVKDIIADTVLYSSSNVLKKVFWDKLLFEIPIKYGYLAIEIITYIIVRLGWQYVPETYIDLLGPAEDKFLFSLGPHLFATGIITNDITEVADDIFGLLIVFGKDKWLRNQIKRQ